MTLELLFSALSIFLLRILDVSIGTVRIGMLVRGRRIIAGVLSFVESMIWLIAAAQVLGNLDAPIKFIAYAGGYATGTMLGATIERWLAVGNTLMRIVTPVSSENPSVMLHKEGYYATVLNATGRDGDVRVCFSVIPRKRVPTLLKLVNSHFPKAFVTFEETNQVNPAAISPAKLRK